MSNHTQGPWEYKRLVDNAGTPYATYYQAHIDLEVCMVWAPVGNVEQEANARLIAAAPEMFEIIQKLSDIDWIEGSELHRWIHKSREIVRKVDH